MPRSNPLQSSLFPFMSVLACTIGALVVLLAIMSLSSVEASDEASDRQAKKTEAAASPQALSEALARPAPEDVAQLEEAYALWQEVDEELVDRGFAAGLSAFEIVRRLESAHRVSALKSNVKSSRPKSRRLRSRGVNSRRPSKFFGLVARRCRF